MDEEQRALEELIRKMQDASASSEDFARANRAAESALMKFTKTSLADVTKGVAAFGGSVMDGNRSFSSLTPVVDSLTKVVSSAAKAIPFVGKALGGLAEAAGQSFNFLIGQLDQTIQAFQQVSQTGAIGSDGLSAFRDQAFSSMMTLQQFSEAVTNNSTTLARFGGATFAATQEFSNTISALASEGGIARRLGRSTSDIAESVGAFMELQAIQGRQQMFTGEALRRGTEEYILDLDKLSRLTGQSAKDIQDQQIGLMLDNQFAAFAGRLGEQGERVRDFVATIGKDFPNIASGLKDIIATGGAASSDAGRALLRAIGPGIREVAMNLKSADDIPGAIANMRQLLGASLEDVRLATQSGVISPFTESFAEFQRFANAETATNVNLNASRQGAIDGTNALTASITAAATQIDEFAKNLDAAVINNLLPGVAGALTGLTNIFNEAIKFIDDQINGEGSATRRFFNPEEEEKGFFGRLLTGGVGGLGGAGIGGILGGILGTFLMPVGGTAAGAAIGAKGGALAGAAIGNFQAEIREALGDFFGMRYMGGPVEAGKPYVIGERGPEIMVPDTDGMVLPNSMLAGPVTGFNAMDVPAPQPAQEVTIPASVTRTQESQGNAQMEMMQTQINKLDEMIRLMGRQITATDKVRTAVS